jgi:hypothetical protein
MAQMRKVAINLPAALVESAEAIRDALGELKYDSAWKRLADMRGKVSFGASWQELRRKFDED